MLTLDEQISELRNRIPRELLVVCIERVRSVTYARPPVKPYQNGMLVFERQESTWTPIRQTLGVDFLRVCKAHNPSRRIEDISAMDPNNLTRNQT
jgi:hypothetical protein